MGGHTPGDTAGPDGGTSDAFFARVYEELRSIARARMRAEPAGLSLQTTELVHEAYLRLRPEGRGEWKNRAHFFYAAAQAMRRILVDRARARGSIKRGGDSEGRPAPKVSLDLHEVAALADDQDPETILALDRAIERLALQDERAAKVVRLRFWAGLSVEEVAETLETSTRTVLRIWAFARAWLYGELSKG
ncbi:MAG: ECF-type sigma factor [Candidatus Eiseniibacteriota bacterium]